MLNTQLKSEGFVEKSWGGEFIFANNSKYCGKILTFTKDSMCSMHFHSEKDETWLVLEGKFTLTYIDTTDASQHVITLSQGEAWRNYPMEPHQLTCLEEGVIVEVSTADSEEDNHRILPGDNQKTDVVKNTHYSKGLDKKTK